MSTVNGYEKPGRCASVYSEVQTSRLKVSLPLPSVLKSSFDVVDGPKSSAAGNPGLIRSRIRYSFNYACIVLVMIYVLVYKF